MKKILAIITLVFMLFSLTACDNSADNANGNANDNSGSEIETSELSSEKFEQYLNETKFGNIELGEDFYINFPSEIHNIEIKEPEPQSFSEFEPEFKACFNYLFPNREFNLSELFYETKIENSDGSITYNQFTPAENVLDKLKNGEIDYNNMLTYESNNNLFFSSASPIMSAGVRINKGTAYALALEDTTSLAGWLPYDDFEFMPGVYQTNSEEKFRLLDKEVSVKDAVDFAEEYLNNIPHNSDENLKIAVDRVYVLKIDEEHYGYRMTTSREYKGVPFSTTQEGERQGAEEYAFDMSEVFVPESDNLDFAIGINMGSIVTEKETLSGIVSPEKAMQIVSETLSGEVNFQLQRVQVIYSQIRDENTAMTACTPVYEFTLFNPNDGLTYVVYVDLKSGKATVFSLQ